MDALRGCSATGFLENNNPNGLIHHHQNLYYGVGNIINGDMGLHHVENGGMGLNNNTTVKQEMCNMVRDHQGDNRVLWGFPWQINGEETIWLDFDSTKRMWNGVGSSSWHGLLNSPLT
ncbi:hypothetical protein HAX54_023900 [Datura stramonium]|uniref:Uncharacterized protein n=1 Tax=Datura stramonium TaxID=4076 RepID=A0ABS8S4Y8_DATST|nr:hypothetical protein [Datura stramonium]